MIWLLSLEADLMLCVCVASGRAWQEERSGLSASPKPLVRYSGVGGLLTVPQPDLLVFGGDYRA